MSKENKFKNSKLYFISGFVFVSFLVVFFGISMFYQGVSGAFVWDDYFLMKHPLYLRMGFGLDSVLTPVLTNPALFWRPIGMLTVGSQWDLTADAVFAKRVNIFLISLFCLSLLTLLFLESKKLLNLKVLAFAKNNYEYVLTLLLLFGLFFLVLPSNYVASAFVSSRFSVLGGIFIIWAIICIRYLSGVSAFIGAGIFYALSLLSIESAIAMFPVLLMCSFLRSKEYETLRHLNAMNGIGQEDPLDLGFVDYLNYQIKNSFLKYLSITLLVISFLYLALRFYFLGVVFVVSENVSFWGILANSGAFFYAPLAHWGTALPGVAVAQWKIMSVVFVFIGIIIFSLKHHQTRLFALSSILHEILSSAAQKKQTTNLCELKLTILPSGLRVDNDYFVLLKRQALNTIHYIFLMISLFIACVIACAIVMNWSIPQTYILYSTDGYVIAPIIYLLLFVSIIHLVNALGINKDYVFLKKLVLEKKEMVTQTDVLNIDGQGGMAVAPSNGNGNGNGNYKSFDLVSKLGLVFIVVFLIFGVFLGLTSMKQTQEAWKSSERLWTAAHNYSVNVGEVNALSDMNLMILMSQRKDSVEKIKTIGEALWVKLSTKPRLLRHELASIATYGALLTEHGEENKATAMLTIMLPKSASEPLVAINLARSALKAQKTIEAMGALNFALDNYKKSWVNDKQAVLLYGMRSEVYANLGEKEKSEDDLRHSNKILESVKQKEK